MERGRKMRKSEEKREKERETVQGTVGRKIQKVMPLNNPNSCNNFGFVSTNNCSKREHMSA